MDLGGPDKEDSEDGLLAEDEKLGAKVLWRREEIFSVHQRVVESGKSLFTIRMSAGSPSPRKMLRGIE